MKNHKKVEDDNFFKGIEIVEEVSFVEDPGLIEFRSIVAKLEGKYSYVDASYVKKGTSALYKAFVAVDSEHKRLYLLFPRTIDGEKRFVIGRKIINTWEDGFEIMQKRFKEDIDTEVGFRNNPFEILKDLKLKEV